MQSTWKKTLATFRRHSKRRGLVRLELKVPQEDAALLRRVVGALADPAREAAARAAAGAIRSG